MSSERDDDLTKVIEQAIRDHDDGVIGFRESAKWIAADIAPLIEAREREARAEAWDETAEEAYGWGWLHDWALADVKGRNPYREDEDNG